MIASQQSEESIQLELDLAESNALRNIERLEGLAWAEKNEQQAGMKIAQQFPVDSPGKRQVKFHLEQLSQAKSENSKSDFSNSKILELKRSLKNVEGRMQDGQGPTLKTKECTSPMLFLGFETENKEHNYSSRQEKISLHIDTITSMIGNCNQLIGILDHTSGTCLLSSDMKDPIIKNTSSVNQKTTKQPTTQAFPSIRFLCV
jgi:hypothetical protein